MFQHDIQRRSRESCLIRATAISQLHAAAIFPHAVEVRAEAPWKVAKASESRARYPPRSAVHARKAPSRRAAARPNRVGSS